MTPNRKLMIGLLAIALLAAFVVLTSPRSANPLAKLELENVDSIIFTPAVHLSTPTQPPTKMVLLPEQHRRVIDALRAAQIDWSPSKWQSAGEMIICSSDGTAIELDFYETGTDLGAFSIGRTYYRFLGELEFSSYN